MYHVTCIVSAFHPSTLFVIVLVAWRHRMYGMYYVRWRIIIIFVDVPRDVYYEYSLSFNSIYYCVIGRY